MCGIVGLVDVADHRHLKKIVKLMADTMTNRGPDGYGEFVEGPVAIAMRRLSVIDLAHGWQPLRSADESVVAFQNGEIYNYRELRKELESHEFVFCTNSDTEVLAHGYMKWGIEGLLSRIDGMYAIAILDRIEQTLYLARDRFGEKPLYYCEMPGGFAFSSDLRSLAALPWVGHEIDPLSLDRYLALHYVPGDRTIFEEVKRVLPGEWLSIPLRKPVPIRHRYYTPPIGKGRSVCDAELAEVVEDAVRSRLIADVPVGVFLSGGLDSSIISALASRHMPKIDTFSMGFQSKEHDESDYAKLLAQKVGSTHHHFIFDDTKFIELLPKVARALDEPVGDQAMLPLYWLCEEARKHVTVVLSGEGADEVFAGYSYYSLFAVKRNLKAHVLTRIKTKLSNGQDRLICNDLPVTPSGFPLLADISDRRAILSARENGEDMWERWLMKWLHGASDPLQRATCCEIATWLVDDLLVKFDRMAMAHSLEGRAPYLYPKLVEIGVRRLPSDERMAGENSKVALRRVAARWLPKEVFERQKQGFVLPMRTWIDQWFKVKGGPGMYFSENVFPLLSMEKVTEIVRQDLEQGIFRERFLFALILLCEWYQSFLSDVKFIRESYRQATSN
jgi:asparagine synthase (glutamine-hydrolysing)